MTEKEQRKEALIAVPPEGSLGLLALGAVGLKAWRQKRIETGYEEKLLESVSKAKEEMKQKMEMMKKMMEQKKKLEEEKKKTDEQKISG